MTDLFSISDFASYVQQDVDTASATVARRVAGGWLMSAGILTFPTVIPDDLFAWAIELAAIAFRHPDGTATEGIDDYSFSADRQRRKEILDAARASPYSGTGGPVFSFPDPDWHWTAVPVPTSFTNLTF